MFEKKIFKTTSIIFSILGLSIVLATFLFSVADIEENGPDSMRVFWIAPCTLCMVVIIIDFLITLSIFKGGFLFSSFSSVVKMGIMIFLIPRIVEAYFVHSEALLSEINFFVFTLIILIPSLFNMLRLRNSYFS